jgi:hypothetical protein
MPSWHVCQQFKLPLWHIYALLFSKNILIIVLLKVDQIQGTKNVAS